MEMRDVLIIGAGPVGLFAVHQCGMLGLSAHVVDSLPEIGGQCSALYPEKPIYDIPAYPQISGGELIHQLEAQAAPFQPAYHLGQAVISLKKCENTWNAHTADGRVIPARSIIIAGGGGAFGPNRPPLDHLSDYEGMSVFYMVRQRADFAGKRIVIAGGGDSAVDWALSLSDIAAQVTLVHRRAKFRASPESIRQLDDRAAQGKIDICTPYQLQKLEGENGQISAVYVRDLDGAEKNIPADILLAFFGLSPNLGPIATWGLGAEHHHIPVTQHNCATNTPGIFAIGDIATYPDKLKLILSGFAEAAQAAHAVRAYLSPGEVFHFEYSTTKGVP